MYVRCCSCNNEDMRSENMRLQLEFDATTPNAARDGWGGFFPHHDPAMGIVLD